MILVEDPGAGKHRSGVEVALQCLDAVEQAAELLPEGRQPVFDARRHLGVGLALEDAEALAGSDASTDAIGDGGATPPETGDGGGVSTDASSDSSSGPTRSPTEALCDRVVGECKNTYYKDAADCVKQSLDYWGTCPARITALDAYSECIGKLPCSTIGGSYNPSSTPCASLYKALASTKCD